MVISFADRVTISPDVMCRTVGDEAVLMNLKTELYLGAFGDPDVKLGFSFCGNRMASIAVGLYVGRLLTATMGAL
jgi:hypothetical protein